MKFFIAVKIQCCALLLSACALNADSLINVKGRIVGPDSGRKIENCSVAVIQGGERYYERRIGSAFRESFVVGSGLGSRIFLEFECEGFSDLKRISVPEMPKNIDDYVDVGIVKMGEGE